MDRKPLDGHETSSFDGRNGRTVRSLRDHPGMKGFKDALVAITAIALLYGFFFITGIGCPIKFMTGISCPGCGMTRACVSAAMLRFDRAFDYHPLWVLMPPWAGLFLFRKRIPKRVWNALGVITVMLFVIVYILRLLDTSDRIVVFEPQNGLFGIVIRRIICLFHAIVD